MLTFLLSVVIGALYIETMFQIYIFFILYSEDRLLCFPFKTEKLAAAPLIAAIMQVASGFHDAWDCV